MRSQTFTRIRPVRRSKGTALLVALAITAVLVTILTVAARSQQLALRAEANRMEMRRTRLVADNAVQHAMEVLTEGASGITPGGSSQTASATTGVTNTVSTLLDDWALIGASGTAGSTSTVGSFGAMKFTVGHDSYRMQVVDTCSLRDINTISATSLLNFGLTQEEVDCLTDFRTAGETAQADGAKDDYYNGLSNPYNAKEAPFNTFDEILQVKDFTPDVVYDPPNSAGNSTAALQNLPNGRAPALSDLCTAYAYAPLNTAQGTAETNINTATAAVLARLGISAAGRATILGPSNRRTVWASLGSLLARVTNRNDQTIILNNFKIGAATRKEGLVNINTATQNVLQTLPSVTPDIASAIITQQASGFATLGALARVPGVTGQVLQAIADSVTVVSSTFEVRILATAGSSTQPYVAIVEVVSGVPHLVSLGPAPFPTTEMLARWGWATDSTSETVLVDES